MKKKIDAKELIKRLHTVSGLLFFCAGALEFVCLFLDKNSISYQILDWTAIICLLIASVQIMKVIKAEKNMFDEMAEENLCKAKARTLDIAKICLLYLIVALCLFNIFVKSSISLDVTRGLRSVIYIFIGYVDVSVGYYFKKYEEE